MSHNSLDPQVLAALLDGKLSGDERNRALTQLARSPDDYELFLEAAQTLNDLGDISGGDAAPVNPVVVRSISDGVRHSRRRNWGPMVGVLLAASVAAIFIVPAIRPAPNDPRGLLDGATLLDSPGLSLEAALGDQWLSPGWSVMRGEVSALSVEQRAFRIGVRLADVDAALDARDSVAARIAATNLSALLSDLDASGPLVSLFDQALARGPGTELDAAARALRDFVASPRYTLGVLLEQARLASIASQTQLFDDAYVRALNRAADDASLDNATRAELDRLLDSLRDGVTAGEQPAVQQQAGSLIRLLGG